MDWSSLVIVLTGVATMVGIVRGVEFFMRIAR